MTNLAPGLLVAAPPLADPNFDESVVLLAAHSSEGAFGWVINGREVMSLAELLVRAEITEQTIDTPGSVRVGGPVSTEQVWLVYRSRARFAEMEGQFDVGEGITASASRKVLEAVVEGHRPEGLLGLLGYAGWGPSQLENEIRVGAWLPTDLDPSILFDVPRSEIWRRAYEMAGTSPIAFTSRTVGSA